MKRLKRSISLLLILMLVALSLPLTALAEEAAAATGSETVGTETSGSAGNKDQSQNSGQKQDSSSDNTQNGGSEAGTIEEGTGSETVDSTTVDTGAGVPAVQSDAVISDYSVGLKAKAYSGGRWGSETGANEIIGTTGKGLAAKGFEFSLDVSYIGEAGSEGTKPDLGIEYSTHVSNIGWMDYVSNGAEAGDPDYQQNIEGIKIKLTGTDADKYDIWYCAHVSNIGWMDWAKNDALAGTTGLAQQVEAVKIVILPAGTDAPGLTTTPAMTLEDYAKNVNIAYQAHVANIGWQNPVTNGQTAGTTGQNLALEAINITLNGNKIGGGVEYQAHIADIGDQGTRYNGDNAGTTGQSKAVQALQIQLTGTAKRAFDIYYRVHITNYGWMDWAKNGEWAGSKGLCYSLQAIEIKLIPKGQNAPGNSYQVFVSGDEYRSNPGFDLKAHVSNVGWQGFAGNGGTAGIENGSQQIEALEVKAGWPKDSSISVRTHVSNIGWQNWVTGNDVIAGTTGQGLGIEAVCLNLNGKLGSLMDIWYQVQVKDYGWSGWAVNGQPAGSIGGGKPILAIRCRVIPKGSAAPGSTADSFREIRAPYSDCIVVNIDRQEMTLYRNGSAVVVTPVVTGTRGSHDTPRGDFTMYGHSTGVTLSGVGYSSYVNFWMPFYQENGVHDASWRSQFGGLIYTYNGSHGCVNTPYDAARTIYYNSWVGMHVVVQ